MKSCNICGSTQTSLGTVAFDRNNAGVPIINTTPMEYVKCDSCNFISCPEMLCWSPKELGDKVYNKDYILYDPDYISHRPTSWGNMFASDYKPKAVAKIKHLDYGSGMGVMSEVLRKHKWNSESYDPYSSPSKPSGKFNFITAIEVVEHSLDILGTVEEMKSMLDRRGVIVFSTQLATKDTDISWWYIGARNGHISIQSETSLKIVAKKMGMFFSSINPGLHILQYSRSDFTALQRGELWQ